MTFIDDGKLGAEDGACVQEFEARIVELAPLTRYVKNFLGGDV